VKSSERCKETYQGDRCTRERGHETSSKDNPNVHVGGFTMWNENGQLLKVQGAEIRKRNRTMNRAVRNLSSLPLKTLHPVIRKELSSHVNQIIAHFGGEPIATTKEK
jgi:hypothetical protein